MIVCVRCQRPARRIDAGTQTEVFGPWSYNAVGERIIWCDFCKALLCQKVDIRVRDGGVTAEKKVDPKMRTRGEGTS